MVRVCVGDTRGTRGVRCVLLSTRSDTMRKFFFGCLLCIPFLFLSSCGCYRWIIFDRNCNGWLENSSNAQTVELAHDRLSRAITYVESHNLKNGSTHFLWSTPQTQLSLWYENLIAAPMGILGCFHQLGCACPMRWCLGAYRDC